MEFKGTQGNWQLDIDYPKSIRAVNTDGEPLIVECKLFENYKSRFHLEMTKARIHDKKKYQEMQKTIMRLDQEDYANAKLISAAPDLLSALIGMCTAFDKLEKKMPKQVAGKWSDRFIQKADEAIKKAIL